MVRLSQLTPKERKIKMILFAFSVVVGFSILNLLFFLRKEWYLSNFSIPASHFRGSCFKILQRLQLKFVLLTLQWSGTWALWALWTSQSEEENEGFSCMCLEGKAGVTLIPTQAIHLIFCPALILRCLLKMDVRFLYMNQLLHNSTCGNLFKQTTDDSDLF